MKLDSAVYYGGEYDNSFAVKFTNSTNKQFTLSSIWRSEWSGPRWCRKDTFKTDECYLSSKDIAEIELQDEQLFFLNWSSEWETHIWPYWEGRTEFKTIEEFIQNLKESAMTAEPLYTSAMIKAAR